MQWATFLYFGNARAVVLMVSDLRRDTSVYTLPLGAHMSLAVLGLLARSPNLRCTRLSFAAILAMHGFCITKSPQGALLLRCPAFGWVIMSHRVDRRCRRPGGGRWASCVTCRDPECDKL
jgi:hypothetical protein